MRTKLALLLLPLFVGCMSSGLKTEWGRVVPIAVTTAETTYRGTGSVIGPNQVLTVEHVHHPGVEGAQKVWVCAGRHVISFRRVQGAPGSYEALVVLTVTGDPWPPEDQFAVGWGFPAETVITQDGPHPFPDSIVIPGHSGGVAMDKSGVQIGCVSARECPRCAPDDQGKKTWVLPDQTTVLTFIPVGFKPY
jgi:hypothetical protein